MAALLKSSLTVLQCSENLGSTLDVEWAGQLCPGGLAFDWGNLFPMTRSMCQFLPPAGICLGCFKVKTLNVLDLNDI